MGDNLGLLRGTLDLLILNALSTGEKHGYAVSEWIEAVTDGSLLVEEGTLYPALHRLENRGLLTAEWQPSETGRDAKFYKLTRKGRSSLKSEAANWERLSEAIRTIMRTAREAP
jgi:transcriptional regulator